MNVTGVSNESQYLQLRKAASARASAVANESRAQTIRVPADDGRADAARRVAPDTRASDREMTADRSRTAPERPVLQTAARAAGDPVRPDDLLRKLAEHRAQARTEKPADDSAKPAVHTAKPPVGTAKDAAEPVAPAVTAAKPPVNAAKPDVAVAKDAPAEDVLSTAKKVDKEESAPTPVLPYTITIKGLHAAWGTDNPLYDLTGNGTVGVEDLLELISKGGKMRVDLNEFNPPSPTLKGFMAAWNSSNPIYDLNGDGTVGISDLLAFISGNTKET